MLNSIARWVRTIGQPFPASDVVGQAMAADRLGLELDAGG